MNQMDQFEKALALLEPQMRDAFLAAVADVRSSAQLGMIVQALEAGRIDQAIVYLNLNATFWQPLDDMMKQAFLLGGRNAIAALPVIPDPATLGKL